MYLYTAKMNDAGEFVYVVDCLDLWMRISGIRATPLNGRFIRTCSGR